MSQLETNTASLQAILDVVNKLPEAGSGGGDDSNYYTLKNGVLTITSGG